MPTVAIASFRSVAEMFLHRISSTPDSEAFTHPQGEGWRTITWHQAGERARAIACGLLALGIAPEQRCAILSSTRLEWILADQAVLLAGAATTAVYPNSAVQDQAWIIADSDARVVFTEHAEHSATLQAIRERIPSVQRVIQIEPGGEASHDLDPGRPGPWVVTLQALEQAGRAWQQANPDLLEERAQAVGPDQLATLIYTSGTTGRPKGVELTHRCWVFEGEAMDALGIISPADTQYLFLPLAHSFAKVLLVATIRIGIHTVVDGRAETLARGLRETRPTFVAGVPRVFEKLYNAIVREAHEGGRARTAAFRRALAVGAELSAAVQAGRKPSRALLLRYGVAERLFLSHLQRRFGGRLRFFISGGAPLSRELAEFFHAAGVLIVEGYGLTESGAASFVNRPEAFRFGTVGRPLPGVQHRLDPTDGEILIRSKGNMRGYHGLPQDTAAVLDDQGWLRTGDLGTVDQDGFLTITGRKKDLIKTSGGKYVAPQLLEGRLKALSPWVSHVVVHGNQRNFVSALLTLDEAHARGWARHVGRPDLDLAALARDERVHASVQADVDRLNDGLASHEQIKRFAILPRELSVEEGELTPTLKVRRQVVEARYRALLDGFYQGSLERL